MTERRVMLRFLVAAVCLALALVGLGARLAYLHLGAHEATRASVQRTRQVERKLLAARGNICDRGGNKNILALSLVAKDVCANPAEIVRSNMVVAVAATLAEQLDVAVDVLAVNLSRPDRQFAYVKRFVLDDQLEGIRNANLPGIFYQEQIMRHYPHGQFMCHVLGFVNYENTGSAGIEQQADRYLRGCPGLVESRVNALRRELYWEEGQHVPAIRGADVRLTIDQNVQFIVEQALDEVMQEHTPHGVWAIVQQVRTGELLAMASRPAYNPNEFRTAEPDSRLNRAISYVYEPGSTFKLVAFAGAFEEGIIAENEVIDCENGSWMHGGRLLRDSHGYGLLTVADGLKKSSNILTAKVALRLGEARMYRYMKAFGIGEKTGVDLPGEEQGILHAVPKWSNISLSRIAIGQGVALTSLQLLGAYCAIANGGFLMRPYVIKQVTGSDGTVLFRREPAVVGRAVSSETADRMCRLLARVTEEGGTGRRARVEGYETAGKTGTAQKPIPGGYSHTDYMASFVGFLPAAAPEIAIIVVVDTPRKTYHTGGSVAGPVFGKIAEQAVRYLDIPPTEVRALAQR